MKPYVLTWLLVVVTACTPVTGPSAGKSVMDAARMMDQGETTEAIQLLEQLAAQGDDRAMVQVGLHYDQGAFVKQDYAKSMDWYLRAFALQNADAFVCLGRMHYHGHGVPQNKKIAYGVFLTTHMCGMGSQSTQYVSNRYLRRLLKGLSRDDIKDCLSNYTPGYITTYLEQRGRMKGIPDKFRPSEDNPALRDLGWFLDSELDAIYGEATEAEKRAREERNEKRRRQIEAIEHTLVFQVRFYNETAHRYRSYEAITDRGMESGLIPWQKLPMSDDHLVYEHDILICADQHRFVTIATDQNEVFVFKIDHSVKPTPRDWSEWQKASYVLGNRMERITLLNGREPDGKRTDLPPNSPELRFKVVKP